MFGGGVDGDEGLCENAFELAFVLATESVEVKDVIAIFVV